MVLERVQAVGLGEIRAPSRFGLAPVLRVHDAQFVDFLGSAWKEWVAAGNKGEAIPDCWPARRMVQRIPDSISGKLGYYAMAAETSISGGSWEAACASADGALTGGGALSGRVSGACLRFVGRRGITRPATCMAAIAFSIMRPSRPSICGTTAAARSRFSTSIFITATARRISFTNARMCCTASSTAIHWMRFRTYSGYADEIGADEGVGYNQNLPLPRGTDFAGWRAALDMALSADSIGFAPGALVVVARRRYLRTRPDQLLQAPDPDFTQYGRLIGALRKFQPCSCSRADTPWPMSA